jgi:protein-L-isoaspartate(D-aspartate) O-methyltransferase
VDRIAQAFAKYDRVNFVPAAVKSSALEDRPLPIGYSQTISQPTTVEMMLEWLDAQPGDKVLDVGSGSGWSTALLSHIVGPKGRIYAVELVPELVEFGRQNAERAGVKNASFHQAGEHYGLPEHAPYDRILVSAAAYKLPKELVDQLKPGGPSTSSGQAKLVIPVHNSIYEISKNQKGEIKSIEHPGFVFVPLL